MNGPAIPAFLFAVSALAALSTAQSDATAPQLEWHDDLTRANEIAAEEGRPLLIVFR